MGVCVCVCVCLCVCVCVCRLLYKSIYTASQCINVFSVNVLPLLFRQENYNKRKKNSVLSIGKYNIIEKFRPFAELTEKNPLK